MNERAHIAQLSNGNELRARHEARPAAPFTVTSVWTRAVIAGAVREGLDAAGLLREGGLDAATVHDPAARVAYDAHVGVWRAITREVGDPAFGLRFASEQVEAFSFGVAGHLAMVSSTLGEALSRLVRFSPLVNELDSLHVEATPRFLAVWDTPAGSLGPWPQHYAETILATYVLLARRWTGEPLAPYEVRFQHAAAGDAREHERLFGVRPRFGAEGNVIVFEREKFPLPLRYADPALSLHLEQYAERLLARRAVAPAWPDVLHAEVREAVARGEAEVGPLAARLGLGVRSLQRRAQRHGVCVASLLDEARRARAEEMLRRPGVTTDEIALALGFADARAFRRAFKRWTGRTPRAAGGVEL